MQLILLDKVYHKINEFTNLKGLGIIYFHTKIIVSKFVMDFKDCEQMEIAFCVCEMWMKCTLYIKEC